MARDQDNQQQGKQQQQGSMSVQEAGRRGGESTAATHGREFYQDIGQKGGEIGGQKGGQRVKELIEEGKQAEGGQSPSKQAQGREESE